MCGIPLARKVEYQAPTTNGEPARRLLHPPLSHPSAACQQGKCTQVGGGRCVVGVEEGAVVVTGKQVQLV